MVNDLKRFMKKYTEYKNENEIITGKLRILKQRFVILDEKLTQDEDKVKLGETMLNLPNLGRKWKETWNTHRYYSLAYTIITGCSKKYLQMAISSIVDAFFHDIYIMRYFKSDGLRFISNLTPCDKKLDECVYLNREYIFTKYQLTLNLEQWET